MPTLGELLQSMMGALPQPPAGERAIPGVPSRSAPLPIQPPEPSVGALAASGMQADPHPTQPHLLRQPAPLPGPPARGNAELQTPAPELSMFDVYGAPVPSRKPLDLGQMLFTATTEESPPLPERKSGAPAKTSNSPTPVPASRAASGQRSRGGQAEAESLPPAAQPAPTPSAGSGPMIDPATGRFLMQMGLSLMVPRWGGPLSNIGQAVGEGAEAVTRGAKSQQEQELNQKKLELEEKRINKMGLGRRGRSESSGSKRVKEKTPQQQFAANLSPEGAIFFQQRIKDLNKVDEEAGETADQKMQRIMQETQTIDRKARASRGQGRSDEIPDSLLSQVAGTAQESLALNAVAADPVQRALVQQRLDAIKSAKAAKTNAGTK